MISYHFKSDYYNVISNQFETINGHWANLLEILTFCIIFFEAQL